MRKSCRIFGNGVVFIEMTPTQETGIFPEIPGFDLQERIGEGGLGVVYKALQKSLHRTVAIKVMREDLAADGAFRERFDKEWKTAAELKHQNIVQILEAGTTKSGLHYFVMEHVGGDSLERSLQKGETLSESQALTVAEAVANALKYALESGGTIHGDLRPGNIMLEPDGTVKVSDFFGIPAETHPYLSPEAESADREELDFKSDVYSLGAILYHLLTGQSPLAPKTAAGLSGKSASVLDPPDSIVDSLSSNLSLFIEKLLIRVRQVRYGSWDDLITDLESVKSGHPPTRLPPSGASAVRRTGQTASADKPRSPSPPPPKEEQKAPPEEATEMRLKVEEEAPPPVKSEVAPPESSIESPGAESPVQEVIEPDDSGRPGLKIQVRKPAEPEPDTEVVQEFVTVRNKRKSNSGNSLRVVVGVGMVAAFLVACWYLWVHVGAGLFARDERGTIPDPGIAVPPPETPPVIDEPPIIESVPEEPVETIAEVEEDPPETPKGAGLPNEFKEYLDTISPALNQTARRQYRHSEGTLTLWLGKNRDHPYKPHVDRQVVRIRRVAALVKLLEDNEAQIMDARIDPGKVVGMESGKIEVQSVRGGRPSTRAISIDILSDRDYLALLKLADPEGLPVHGAMFMISRGEFDKALQFMNGENIGETEYGELKAWFDDWRGILSDLQAQDALDEVKRLTRRGDFRQAGHKLDLAFEEFSGTDTFQWARKKEIDELRVEITEVVSRMNSRRGTVGESEDESTASSKTAAELGRTPKIEINVQREQVGRGAPNLQSKNVKMRVRLRNREQSAGFKNLTQRVYAVARHSLYENQYRLLIKEEDPLSLPAGGAYQYQTKSVPVTAAENAQAGNPFDYFGWLFVLTEQDGTVLFTKSSHSKLLENAVTVGDVEEGSEFSL